MTTAHPAGEHSCLIFSSATMPVLAHGVTGYGLDRLCEDYRLSVIGHLAIPVWQQSFGLPAGVW
ncbi:MAG: hypothetical protein ACREKG_03865 [Candidatus Rokuibacteriota bacterium]